MLNPSDIGVLVALVKRNHEKFVGALLELVKRPMIEGSACH
jgi:hypothetical protein